jgi:hypothetical protein
MSTILITKNGNRQPHCARQLLHKKFDETCFATTMEGYKKVKSFQQKQKEFDTLSKKRIWQNKKVWGYM